MTCTGTPGKTHVCLNCLTQHITTVAAALDPDRLCDRVRRELRNGQADKVDVGLLLFGPHEELAVDPVVHEVWEGAVVRSPSQQLRLALVHLAAALAAGARI